MHHEFCITFAKADASGEPVEVHHRHVEARNDEEAAIAAAMEAARDGIDVSECDVMIKVVKVIPPELKAAIKLTMAMYAIFRPEVKEDPLSRESIRRGVAMSVGGKETHPGVWEFPTPEASAEFDRRFNEIVDGATSGKPKTNLH